MHAGEVATAQLLEDGEVAIVRLGSGDGVEYADEFGLARYGGVDDVLDDRGVLVVKDLSSSAAPYRVVVVRTSDGDDVCSSGRSDLSRHGAERKRKRHTRRGSCRQTVQGSVEWDRGDRGLGWRRQACTGQAR